MVQYLEDVLQRYGVPVDYWFPSPPDYAMAPHPTLEEAVLASDSWRDEVVDSLKIWDGLPLLARLAGVRLQLGSIDAALKAFEASVSDEIDPTELCILGSLLLEVSSVHELPLGDGDFDGLIVNLDGHTDFPIVSSWNDHGTRGCLEGPHSEAGLRLAVEAFGRAYALSASSHFTMEGPTTASLWGELVALEGLRAGFTELDDIPALQATIARFLCWLDDYSRPESEWWQGRRWLTVLTGRTARHNGLTLLAGELAENWEFDSADLVYKFVSRFTRAEAYLKGRLRESSATATVGTFTPSFSTLLDEVSEYLKFSDPRPRDEGEKSRNQYESKRREVEGSLTEEMGSVWLGLHSDTRNFIVRGEILIVDPEAHGDDWDGAAMKFRKSAELELRLTIQSLRETLFGSELRGKGGMFGELVHSLRFLRQSARSMLPRWTAQLLGDDCLKKLDEVARIGGRGTHHDDRPVSKRDVLVLRELLIGGDTGGGLLDVIVRARPQSDSPS